MYDFVSMYISPSLPTTIRSQPYTIYIYIYWPAHKNKYDSLLMYDVV